VLRQKECVGGDLRTFLGGTSRGKNIIFTILKKFSVNYLTSEFIYDKITK
jgi:hypothetical protein